MRKALAELAEYMAAYANRSRRAIDVTVGQFAWLSTAHLRLPAKLSRKLASRWAGPFQVLAQVGAVSFRLALPPSWRLHDVFHASQLKPAVGYTGDTVQDSGFRPPADDDGEFEVERVLDHRRVRRGRSWVDEYLVKWVGYDLFEATWEPVGNLANAPEALAEFLASRGTPRVRTRESQRGG